MGMYKVRVRYGTCTIKIPNVTIQAGAPLAVMRALTKPKQNKIGFDSNIMFNETLKTMTKSIKIETSRIKIKASNSDLQYSRCQNCSLEDYISAVRLYLLHYVFGSEVLICSYKHVGKWDTCADLRSTRQAILKKVLRFLVGMR